MQLPHAFRSANGYNHGVTPQIDFPLFFLVSPRNGLSKSGPFSDQGWLTRFIAPSLESLPVARARKRRQGAAPAHTWKPCLLQIRLDRRAQG